MKFATLTTAAFLLSATTALSASFADKVVSALEKQDFAVTNVHTGNGTITVEATRNGKSRELSYDAETGALMSDKYDGHEMASSESDDDAEDDGSDDDGHDDGDDDGHDEGEGHDGGDGEGESGDSDGEGDGDGGDGEGDGEGDGGDGDD